MTTGTAVPTFVAPPEKINALHDHCRRVAVVGISGTWHGCDAGKLIKGKKRHILVDRVGSLLHTLVSTAEVQDRDGGAHPYLISPALRGRNSDSSGMQMISIRPTQSASR